MIFKKTLDKIAGSIVLGLKGASHATGLKEVEGDKLKGIKHMLEDMEATQDEPGFKCEVEQSYFDKHLLCHNPHPCSVTAATQTPLDIETTPSQGHSGSILYTQRGFSDNEVVEETEDSLDKANILTLKELKDMTIVRNILMTITNPEESMTCVQPATHQMQESECGNYILDAPLSGTGKNPTTSSIWRAATPHPGKMFA